MRKQTPTTSQPPIAQQSFTMEQRNYWCDQLDCSLKDLIIAEGKVGANPGLISKYLNENQI